MRRLSAYLLNNIILVFPVYYIFQYVYPGLLIVLNLKNDSNHTSFVVIRLIVYILFLPLGFIAVLTETGGISQTFFILIEVVSAIICLTTADTIISYILNADVGKRILGLKIVCVNGKKASLKQLFIRCLIKYMTLGLCPFLILYPIFNIEKLTIHDRLSKTMIR